VFTTSAITAPCTVVANFVIDTHDVTPSVEAGSGTISPSTVQVIDHGDTTAFTLTPGANHHIDSVGGNCGGSLLVDTFTTNAVVTDCTVVANFALDTYMLTYTAGSGGSITGQAAQEVEHGGDGSEVTAVPGANYQFVDWSDAVATASRTDTNVMADLSVTANFELVSRTVTSSVKTGVGTITPLGAQEVEHGSTTQFTLTPGGGYEIDSVGGSCGGSLASSTYTTGPIVADCTVNAHFRSLTDMILSDSFE
jgi:hypothetical protein